MVLVIMALGAVLVVPKLARFAEEGSLRVVTAKVVSSLRKSHRKAMFSGKMVSLTPSSLSLQIPKKFRIKTTADEIVFFPDGTALQTRLLVYDNHGRHNLILINPFSGLAAQTSSLNKARRQGK